MTADSPAFFDTPTISPSFVCTGIPLLYSFHLTQNKFVAFALEFASKEMRNVKKIVLLPINLPEKGLRSCLTPSPTVIDAITAEK